VFIILEQQELVTCLEQEELVTRQLTVPNNYCIKSIMLGLLSFDPVGSLTLFDTTLIDTRSDYYSRRG
jgi:hypothetical protein